MLFSILMVSCSCRRVLVVHLLQVGYLCPKAGLDSVSWVNTIPEDTNNLYVFALHGKSRHCALWDYDSLLKSNANLFEVSPKRLKDNEKYVVPEEGLSALRGQCVIVSLSHAIVE